MNNVDIEAQGPKKLPELRRACIGSPDQALVKVEPLKPDSPLPLVIYPGLTGVNLIEWAKLNRDFLEAELLKHGAILFRNFGIATVEDFEKVLHAITDELLEYRERSSLRSKIGDKIYTSTDYPATQYIFPHNEHSYSKSFPLKIFFFCLTPAESGGETPIADCRKILPRLSPATKQSFIEKKWMYVRNFNDGFGLPWQTVFLTEDREKVEQYCHDFAIDVEWKEGNRLRTRQVRPAIATHPKTGESVWFNHATFFHVSTLDVSTRDELLAGFNEEDLPNNTYYGDGSEIAPSVMDELRAAYKQEVISFPWQQGDLLMIDNMLTAHSRNPYTGERKVLVAMSEPYNRTDI